ncbi:hypothetical protein SDC9_120154 [bioreactor metagenome]|uniref:Uncharacterized protein n=1 Tax=bioreactor metagenome TaxID=1076179 RepID=A0A645C725_9ZZZZ
MPDRLPDPRARVGGDRRVVDAGDRTVHEDGGDGVVDQILHRRAATVLRGEDDAVDPQ